MPISNKLDSLIKLIKKNLLMEAEQHVVHENYVLPLGLELMIIKK